MARTELAGIYQTDELQPWALRTFDRAYEQQARREKCSRTDFYAGYRAALIELKAWSQFRIGSAIANA